MINKVLAPGQDAGYGLFATSPIEYNAILCTYEGAPVDYEAAVADQYRSHYLMTGPATKRAVDAADFNSCTMLFVGPTPFPWFYEQLRPFAPAMKYFGLSY